MVQLSIVTISYKDPAGLLKTLHSLQSLLQDCPFSWEHVVIDHSPAINKTILAELPNNWPLAHCSSEIPTGIYAALNEGIEKSKGQLVWLLNGGDALYTKENLVKVIQQLTQDNYIDIRFGPAAISQKGRPIYISRPFTSFLANIIGSNQLCHQAMIFRRSVFDRIGLYEKQFKIAADYAHHWAAHLKGLHTVYGAEVICIHDNSGVSNNVAAALNDIRLVQKNLNISFFYKTINRMLWCYKKIRHIILSQIYKTELGQRIRFAWLTLRKP
jgi:glycosyltransferase involved in cell wall biosynthesis